MPFQSDQLAALQSVLDNAAVIAAILGVSLEEAENLLRAAETFVRSASSSLLNRRYVLSFRMSKSGKAPITVAEVLAAISTNRPIVQISSSSAFIRSDPGDTSLTGSIARTNKTDILELVWHEGTLHYVIGGRLIHDEKIASASGPTAPSQAWYKPFAQFSLMLNDHMEGAVQYEKQLRYWKEKKKRILLVGPDGTEKLFHGSLYWWLDTFLTDKLKVYAQPLGFGQDSTDIMVISSSGGVYLIEIKWLGVNEKNTRYARTQITAGLIQVKQYLTKDKSILEGYLVVYDARKRVQHDSDSDYDKRHLHERCREPFLLFLESETPSQIGAELAKPAQVPNK